MRVSLAVRALAVALVLPACQPEPVEDRHPVDKPCVDGEADCDVPYDEVIDELFGEPYVLLADPAPTVDLHNIFRGVVLYGGGCGEHGFTYQVWNVGRSQPPTGLGVLHHQTDDACLDSVREEIAIDLTEAVEPFGCVGRVSIATRTETGAEGYIFSIDPVGCDDIYPPDFDLNPEFSLGEQRE